MTTWTDDKEQELFEAQETIGDLMMLYSAEQNECAGLHAINAELLEALENLTRWVGKGIADGAYSECVNSERALVDLERAHEAIRKASR